MDFKDKVVIITGASSGIGAETAELFASQGATLSLTDINGDWLKEKVAKCTELSPTKGKILQTVGDLTDDAVREKVVNDTIKEFGRIDILLNVAGIANKDTILHSAIEAFDKVIAINLKAPYHMMVLCAPHLIKTKGSIVNVSSTASISPFPGASIYGASKAGIDNLTKNVAQELGPYQVRVNSVKIIFFVNFQTGTGNKGRIQLPGAFVQKYDSVPGIASLKNLWGGECPGFTYTNIGVPQPGQSMPRAMLDAYKPYHLLNRLAEAKEIAETIAFICKSENMTGTNLLIDGGFHISRVQPAPKTA